MDLSTGPSVINHVFPRPTGLSTGLKSQKGLYSDPSPIPNSSCLQQLPI